jgi:hypothetical protein
VPLLKVDRADVATTFSNREVESLPLFNRNFTSLELLTAGTSQLFPWQHASFACHLGFFVTQGPINLHAKLAELIRYGVEEISKPIRDRDWHISPHHSRMACVQQLSSYCASMSLKSLCGKWIGART